jgi:hypothetical protein
MPVVGSLASVATTPPAAALALSATAARRNDRFPTARIDSTCPSASSDSPAES